MTVTSKTPSVEVLIVAAREKNQIATEEIHYGHTVKWVQWDSEHNVKMCTKCECTVSNPMRF